MNRPPVEIVAGAVALHDTDWLEIGSPLTSLTTAAIWIVAPGSTVGDVGETATDAAPSVVPTTTVVEPEMGNGASGAPPGNAVAVTV